MKHILALTALLLAPLAELRAAEATFQSQHLAIGLSPERRRFLCSPWIRWGTASWTRIPSCPRPMPWRASNLTGQTYQLKGKPVWRVTCSEKVLTLRSDYAAGAEAPPFTLTFNQKANHATLLGLMKPGERQMSLPCVLHLPDMGTLRITCSARTPGSTTTRGGS